MPDFNGATNLIITEILNIQLFYIYNSFFTYKNPSLACNMFHDDKLCLHELAIAMSQL
jgi:hypothetical protein